MRRTSGNAHPKTPVRGLGELAGSSDAEDGGLSPSRPKEVVLLQSTCERPLAVSSAESDEPHPAGHATQGGLKKRSCVIQNQEVSILI